MKLSAEQRRSRGTMARDPRILEQIREAWGCDCGGALRGDPVPPHIRAMGGEVEKLTGDRPPTCPWRAFYDPLVSEASNLARTAALGLGAAYAGEDPPAILLDAVLRYTGARDTVKCHDIEERRKKEAAKRGKSG